MKRLKNKYKVPLLMIEHWSGWLDERKSRLSPGQKYRTFLAAQSVDLLLPVTRQLGEKLAQKLGCDYVLWRNPVDPGLFYPQTEKRFDFIHLSTLDANKKPDSILRAFCEVLKIKPGLKLSIGGDGPIQGLQSLIEELGIAPSVELHGRLSYEEAAERIRSSRCLVQFSGYENLPCVVTEALAAGLRVISSKVGGIAEVVREGENGHLVEAQNEKALIKAMLNILNAPSAPPAAYTESKPEHLLEEFEKVLEKLFSSRA
jgi:glycosyltransferase involved in cell wall biosynthesis